MSADASQPADASTLAPPAGVAQPITAAGVPTVAPPAGTSTMGAAELPSPPPGYEFLGELGRGAMGVVYKARDMRLGRVVALKMILAGGHAGAESRARFKGEAQAAARLQHPNVVQVFEVGEHEGHPFLAMEFCPGGSLHARLAGTPLPPKEAAQLTATLAGAVQAAHAAGVIHRDLKPLNVLLDATGAPKVADFGLARRLDEVGADANRRGGWHAQLHGPRAGIRQQDRRPTGRHLCAGSSPLRVADRPPAVPGSNNARDAGAGSRR